MLIVREAARKAACQSSQSLYELHWTRIVFEVWGKQWQARRNHTNGDFHKGPKHRSGIEFCIARLAELTGSRDNIRTSGFPLAFLVSVLLASKNVQSSYVMILGVTIRPKFCETKPNRTIPAQTALRIISVVSTPSTVLYSQCPK